MCKFEYLTKAYQGDSALTWLGTEGWEVAGILAPGKGHNPPLVLLKRRLPKTKSEVTHDAAAKLDVPVVDVPLSDYVTDEMDYAKPDYRSAGGYQIEALDDALRIDWARQCANREPSTAAQRWAHEVICLLSRQPAES